MSESVAASSGHPLEGIKVLDLSRWIAGPLCAMLLADMGADVIKVERPQGEDARDLHPRIGGESAYFMHYNRNKRGITLSTRDAEGIALLRSLIAWADVLVQNYRPGTLEAMGLDTEELERINPGLIVTDISGYGQSGEWSRRPLFNSIAEATTGAMSLTGDESTGPLMSGTFVADHTAGLFATIATLTALHERGRTGRGQRADVSLFDSLLSVLGYPLTAALNGLPTPPPIGNRDKTAAPGNLYATGDGRHIYIDAGTDGLFAALRTVVADPDGVWDDRFDTGDGRWKLVEQVDQVIEDWTRSTTAAEASALLEGAGVPHGIVQTLDEVVAGPLVAERDMIAHVETDEGTRALPGVSIKLSRTPGSVRSAPPRLGQHTDEVLAELCGVSAEQLAELRAGGSI
jgi:crotonobetainyl-CoA:carnitine CoA-transferase CaiB-like acyl-CoA transferase